MRRFTPTLFALAALILGVASTAEAGAPAVRSVSWTTQGDPLASGQPGDDTALASFGAPVDFSGFSDRQPYPDLDAALLAAGLSAQQLEDADFIAFDLNGTSGGVEGASWSFDDGQGGALASSHSFGGLGAGILFNGDLDPASYEALFSVTLPAAAPFVGMVVFDLSGQGVDPFAPGLSASVEGLDAMPVNSPDFSGLGVMHRAGASCGDGLLDAGEQCDDGNTLAGDGCGALCEIEDAGFCGDGVVNVEEQCDDGNTAPGDGCSERCLDEGIVGEVCAPAPVEGCLRAAKASVAILEKKAGNEKWKAKLKGFDGATAASDFGDPVADTTRYDVCLYGDSGQLVSELSVDRAGQTCGKKPCWKDKRGKGFSYKDKESSADGVKTAKVASGPTGKGKLQVKAGNKARRGQAALPTGTAKALDGATSATLQVLAGGATCFEAFLSTVKKADGFQFKAKAP